MSLSGSTLTGSSEPQSAQQPPKSSSRYQSLRRRAASTSNASTRSLNAGGDLHGQHHHETAPVPAIPASATNNSITRSLSRYRRRTKIVSVDNSDVTPKFSASPQPAQPTSRIVSMLTKSKTASSQKENGVPAASLRSPRQELRHAGRAVIRRLDRKMADQQAQDGTLSEESQRQMIADHEERQRRVREKQEAALHGEQDARLDAQTDQKIVEQKKKDLERLQVSLANKGHFAAAQSPKPKTPIVAAFAALLPGRRNKDALSPRSPRMSPTSSTADSIMDNSSRTNLHELIKQPTGIEQGGRGIVPQTDAPVSAINSGDRIVSVLCGQRSLVLQVEPDTTPNAIVRETVKQMGHDFEFTPSECVVIESYGPLSLERRVRRFERIRDVMNSWDRDTHNELVVAPSETPLNDRDLDVEAVPDTEEPPQGIQVFMYHSNKPGKWEKRYVSLLENGQVISSKKPDAKSTDKDTHNLCHMSDYDIYRISETQVRRRLKPPKKFCVAIKSQHKPSMFMDSDNFVHYFCTEDPGVAAVFSQMVQGWRSWYLVDRRPEARRLSIPKVETLAPQLTPTQTKHAPKKSVNVASMNGHRLRVSVDETPYEIGEFEPLIDMKRFDKRLSQFGKDFLPETPDPSTMPPMPESIPAHWKNDSVQIKSEGDKKTAEAENKPKPSGIPEEDEKDTAQPEEKKDEDGKQPKKEKPSELSLELPPKLQDPDSMSLKPPESPSWFPSALAHSAKQREKDVALRPSTSAGIVNPTVPVPGRFPIHNRSASHNRSPSKTRPPQGPLPKLPPGARSGVPNILKPGNPMSMSQSNRKQPPKPLLNLAPEPKEAPQWANKKGGHGVEVPEGIGYLVDLISEGKPKGGDAFLTVPPRSALRRGPDSAPPTTRERDASMPPQGMHKHGSSGGRLSRTRSKSSGAPPSRSMDNMPPVPPLPGHHGGGDRQRRNVSQPSPRDHREHMAAKSADIRGRPPMRDLPPPGFREHMQHQSADIRGRPSMKDLPPPGFREHAQHSSADIRGRMPMKEIHPALRAHSQQRPDDRGRQMPREMHPALRAQSQRPPNERGRDRDAQPRQMQEHHHRPRDASREPPPREHSAVQGRSGTLKVV